MTVNGDQVRQMAGGIAPWVIAAFALIGFFWQQVNPREDIRAVEARLDEKITQQVATLQRGIAENQRQIELRLLIAEHVEYKDRKDKDSARQEDQIRMLLQTRMSRDEHAKDILAIGERLNVERDAVNRIQENVFGAYNIGKQLDNLQTQQVKQSEITATQIAELRRALDMRPPVNPQISR